MGRHDLAVLIPVLNRPHLVEGLVENLRATTPANTRLLFLCDPKDGDEIREIGRVGADMMMPGGNYASKINVGVYHTTEPLLFLAADDLFFTEGWFEKARRRLRPGVGVVGVNDLCTPRVRKGNHATHFLVTRDYAKRPTFDGQHGPLAEVYGHQNCDDEFVATARRRKAIVFATDCIVEHRHFLNGAPMDSTYEKGQATAKEDRALWKRRQRLMATRHI